MYDQYTYMYTKSVRKRAEQSEREREREIEKKIYEQNWIEESVVAVQQLSNRLSVIGLWLGYRLA